MTGERVDIAIVGAGLAGGSLAWRLADPRFSSLRILLLDQHQEFANDRTWCSWRLRSHPFIDDCVASWQRLLVRAPGLKRQGGVELHSSVPYDCLPARRFYRRVLPRLDASAHLELRRGVSVDRVEDIDGGVRLECSGGVAIEAGLAFDSRPPARTPGSLVQHFVGWQIETQCDALDPGQVVLMDFDVPQAGAIHFVYMLPLSRRRALVESTWISPQPLVERVYERQLRSWIGRHLGAIDWQRTRTERGVLPMDSVLTAARRRSRCLSIGIRGGAIRASSGYAFERIQSASDQLVAALETGVETGSWRRGLKPPKLDHAVDAWMDRLLLSRLRRCPRDAPALFGSLLTRCPTDRWVRFLGGRASLADRLAVIRALPAAPMLAEVASRFRRAA